MAEPISDELLNILRKLPDEPVPLVGFTNRELLPIIARLDAANQEIERLRVIKDAAETWARLRDNYLSGDLSFENSMKFSNACNALDAALAQPIETEEP